MYTLYHLKGNKWGMTRRTLEERFSHIEYKKKGITVNDVCETETYSDKDTAADRERELNIRDGYGWNKSQDYRVIIKRSVKGGLTLSKERASEMGKKSKPTAKQIQNVLDYAKTKREMNYDQAEYIRTQYKRGNDIFGNRITLHRLGKVFNVSHVPISNIIHNKTYTTP